MFLMKLPANKMPNGGWLISNGVRKQNPLYWSKLTYQRRVMLILTMFKLVIYWNFIQKILLLCFHKHQNTLLPKTRHSFPVLMAFEMVDKTTWTLKEPRVIKYEDKKWWIKLSLGCEGKWYRHKRMWGNELKRECMWKT